MNMLKDTEKDPEVRASSVNSTGDVYFVPAFSGLYAPYWRKDARGWVATHSNYFKEVCYLILFSSTELFADWLRSRLKIT